MNHLPPIRVRSPEEAATEISWGNALLAVLVVCATLLTGLSVIGLTGPDEPRYAAVAREMARTGDWVTPRLFGQPWFEKPVLYYWAAAAAFRLWGVNEFAARLPETLAALFATLVTAWAALRVFGLEAAWLTLLMLPTTIAMPVLGHAATPDMLFSAFLTAAAVAGAEMLSKPRAGLFARLAFGIFVGVAALAKGPAAVLLAAGAAFLWVLASRRWSASLRLANPVSIVAFCLVAVPWYALAAARNPDFLRIFFLQHNFERYLTPMFHHQQPFWFFGVIILALVLPWTALLVPLAVDALRAVRAGTAQDSPDLFFACWVVFPILFFSFSQSKLPAYVLPAVPPLVLLLAASAARRLAKGEKTAGRWMVLVGCTIVAVSIATGYWLWRRPAFPGIAESGTVKSLLALTVIGGILCATLAAARGARAGIAAAAALVAVLVVGAEALALPKLDPFLSAREVARTTPQELRKSEDVYDFYVGSTWLYGLDFYLDRDRELLPWTPAARHPFWVWTTPEIGSGLLRQDSRWSVVVRSTPGPWLLRSD